MNKLFNIPKMKIVVISAAVIVILSIATVAVVCMNLETIGKKEDAVTDAMAQVSDTESDMLTITAEDIAAPCSVSSCEKPKIGFC